MGTQSSYAAGGGADHVSICYTGPITFPGIPFALASFCYDEVQTPSGVANATFHTTLAAGETPPAQETTITDFLCGTTYGTATSSQVVITPSGQVNGWCKYHP